MKLFTREDEIKKHIPKIQPLYTKENVQVASVLEKMLSDDRIEPDIRLEYYKLFVGILTTPRYLIRFNESEVE